jgi:hypothetical protein
MKPPVRCRTPLCVQPVEQGHTPRELISNSNAPAWANRVKTYRCVRVPVRGPWRYVCALPISLWRSIIAWPADDSLCRGVRTAQDIA